MKVPDKWLAHLKSKRIRASTKERADRGALTTSLTPGTALITDLRWICLKLIIYVRSRWSLLISNPQVFFNCKLGHNILNRNNWITILQREKKIKKLSSQAPCNLAVKFLVHQHGLGQLRNAQQALHYPSHHTISRVCTWHFWDPADLLSSSTRDTFCQDAHSSLNFTPRDGDISSPWGKVHTKASNSLQE